ncbi:hypothetical protein BJ085DRAFT_35199 [Dimargaris cristalligena]|uniref:Phosphatidylinositol-glycan-specific phospholipase D n=1 Tax=Dimargaris cristalligena TaxID=215637 RepID=A0A4V1J3Z7_9FUNG|nr:hypothetical protein BJ085DRAFT_35199 [Dimargaris cristalligena]|eukprot:RKP33799.1 hypothetical protein BJ085DRAFT_35199 [Dimargaris cristalligena]
MDWFFDSKGFPLSYNSTDYKSILVEYYPYVQAGSFFPDWGYHCGNQKYNCEIAHWAKFIRAAVSYIRRNTHFDDKRRKKLIAFLFGVASHDVADILWHGLNNQREGFIRAISFGNMDGQYDLAHTLTDTGAEFILRHSLDMSHIRKLWKLPVTDILAIYNDLGVQLNKAAFQACFSRGYLAAIGTKTFGDRVFPKYAHKSPVMVQQIENYYRGGMMDMMAWVPHCWKELVRWIDGQVEPQEGQRFCELLVDYGGEFKDNMALNYNKKGIHPKVQRESEHGVVALDMANPDELAELESGITVANVDGDLVLSSTDSNVRDENPGVGISRRGLMDYITYGMSCKVLTKSFTKVVTLTTPVSYSGLGSALAMGDFNGSGRESVVIGAPYYRTDSVRGAVFVLDNMSQLSGLSIQNIEDVASLTLLGEDQVIPIRFGYSLAVLDFDQDGIDDLVVGIPGDGARELTYTGKIHIHRGIRGKGLSPSASFVIKFDSPVSRPNTQLGEVIQVADVNGDTYKDLIIGAPFHEVQGSGSPKTDDLAQAGVVFTVFSQRGARNPNITRPDLTIHSSQPAAYENFGRSIAVEIVNNERIMVVGAPGHRDGDNSMAGKLYGFSLANLAQPQLKFSVTGNSHFQQLGQ